MKLFKDIKNLIAGMGITGKHLSRHAITIQYPEEKWTMPERSRGVVILLSDKETGELNCTGCLLCMRACPVAAIQIDAPRDEVTKKRTLLSFKVDNSLCCYCGLCEEACNFCAIKLATKYEFSNENKEELVWDMNKLQEMGRDVDYVDTRKKKPVKAAAPAPKPQPSLQPKAEADTDQPAPQPKAEPAAEQPAPANPGTDKPEEEPKSEQEGNE